VASSVGHDEFRLDQESWYWSSLEARNCFAAGVHCAALW
jgi:hypothetical protein